MRHLFLTAGLAVALAGCGGKDVALQNASAEEVAAATKDAKQLDPGLWRTTVEIVSVEMPGIPAAQKAMADGMMKEMKARKNVSEYCVTKEESEKPPAKMLGGNDDCKFESFALADRKLAAKMICSPAGQSARMAMTINGSYGGKDYALESKMETNVAGGPSGMAMILKAKVAGERIGECKKS